VRLVCVSDTHLRNFEVPEGDVLVHAGDLTMMGTFPEIEAFASWLDRLPHPQKIVIAGNHDFGFESHPEDARALLRGVIYLEDALAEVEGLRVWGSPWQPRFGDWAFNLDRGEPLREKWALIPEGLDLLVTHGPPAGIGDLTLTHEHAGCEDLLETVEKRPPRLHVFGHIHEGYGVVKKGETTFINASICDRYYAPVNPPIVVEFDSGSPVVLS
jgi:predicted phosphodiesterase